MATRYWVGGGSSSNWNATGNTNWGTASGVQNNASVPTSTDDVIFDGAGVGGNTPSIISAIITVQSLTITAGYTSTMTHNAVLTIAGNWTFTNTYTIAGASGVTISATSTITSNGTTWTLPLTFSNTNTKTLSGNLSVSGLFTNNGLTTLNSTTTETLTLSGGLTISQQLSGTATIILTGGTWSTTGAFTLKNSLTFNGNSTVSGTVYYGTGTMTYTSGTITTTGSTLSINDATQTLNTNGITWNNLTSNATSKTITLTSNLSMTGLLTISGTTTINRTTAETITCGSGMTISNLLQGTAEIIWTGGTWTQTAATYHIATSLTISGNVTLSGANTSYGVGTLTYLSGSVTTTSNTLNLRASCTLNTNGITWNNFTVLSAITVTLTSNLSIGGLLTISNTTTINRTTAETITLAGGMTINAGLSGTADINWTGGTWTSNGNRISNNLTIAGNVTISGTAGYGTGTLTYSSGTVITTGSTLSIGANTTFNTNGITWNNVSFSASNGIMTFTSNMYINGLCSVSQNTSFNKTTAETITFNGGITISPGWMVGTAKFIFTGGTYNTSTNPIANDTDINGNITITGNFGRSGGTLTYVSGTVTLTGSTLYITGSCTLNTNGITWNNVTTASSTQTWTLTSNMTINGLLSTGVATTANRTTAETITVNGGFNISANLTGTANITWTGGTWSQGSASVLIANSLTINGNVGFGNEPTYSAGTLTYQSGNITWAPTQALLFRDNAKVDLKGILVGQNVSVTSGGMTLLSNLVINGNYANGTTISANATTNETITVYGNFSAGTGGFGGTAKVIVKGGTMSSTGVSIPFTCPIELDGNITFGPIVSFQSNTVTYKSGRINAKTSLVRIHGNVTLIGFNKISLTRLEVLAGNTLTCDQLPVGSPESVLQISSTGANYTLAFNDTFEKIGRNVAISGANVSRPGQLLVVTNSRFNTNRSTNGAGIRYTNQSPNGFAENTLATWDRTLTGVQGGLVSDPNFVKQG